MLYDRCKFSGFLYDEALHYLQCKAGKKSLNISPDTNFVLSSERLCYFSQVLLRQSKYILFAVNQRHAVFLGLAEYFMKDMDFNCCKTYC